MALNFCKLGAKSRQISGLVLQPAPEVGNNHFRRVGHYRLKAAEDSVELFTDEVRRWLSLI